MALSLWMALMFGKLSGNLRVKSRSQRSGMRRISSAQRTELELGSKYYMFLSLKKGNVYAQFILLFMRQLSKLQINTSHRCKNSIRL